MNFWLVLLFRLWMFKVDNLVLNVKYVKRIFKWEKKLEKLFK